MRKEIGYNKNYSHWNLIRRIELNEKNTIIYILSFKRKRSPYGRIIKHKACLCSHGGMQQWGVNYLETYSLVVYWMSTRAMLDMLILRYIHTKTAYFFLAYTQAGVKLDIFMEKPIGFGVEGGHPR